MKQSEIEQEYRRYVRDFKKTHEKGMEPVCFNEWYDNEFSNRYMAVLGFNTKQWWVYDSMNDVYIDPPSAVLDSLPSWRDDADKADQAFQKILDERPDWLNDEEYWYDGEI